MCYKALWVSYYLYYNRVNFYLLYCHRPIFPSRRSLPPPRTFDAIPILANIALGLCTTADRCCNIAELSSIFFIDSQTNFCPNQFVRFFDRNFFNPI